MSAPFMDELVFLNNKSIKTAPFVKLDGAFSGNKNLTFIICSKEFLGKLFSGLYTI
jgi:hypothetical protein